MRAVKKGGQLTLGFSAEASHRIIDLRECHVLLPELFALVAPLRKLLSKAVKDGQGAGVTLTASDSGIDVLLSNVAARSLTEIERLTDFAPRHSDWRGCRSRTRPASKRWRRRSSRCCTSAVSRCRCHPPDSASDARRRGAASLRGDRGDGGIWQGRRPVLWSGDVCLAADRARQVLAVDAAGPAVISLQSAARLAGRLLQAEHRDLFRRPLTPPELDRFDAVVFDPPRAGAVGQVTQIAASKVPRVVAVSCNPSSFARDARLLVDGGFRLERGSGRSGSSAGRRTGVGGVFRALIFPVWEKDQSAGT